MRNIESQAGKGFKLQTLKAIELFLDAFDKYKKDAKIYVATEKIGDISLKVNGTTHIGESKNYQNPHSINSDEIINTLVNFIDIFLKAGTSADTLTFGFYSTSYLRPSDSFKLEFSILEYLATKKLEDNVIEIVKEKVIKHYEIIYKKDIDKVNQIKKLTIENWRIFLNKIDWKFNQSGNREISIALKERIMKLPLFAKYDYYNGIENAIVGEFRNKLEEQEEYNNFFTRYLTYDDFELIAKTEILNRVHDIQKNNFGEFKTISVAEIPREVNISQDRFFFIEKERKLIRKITNQLIYSKDKYFALLSGKPGQGKSVLCIQVGLEMEQRGYLILFVELSADFTNIIERLKEIGGKHDNVVCIITKCHLNLSLLRKIYNNHSLYKNIKFLFESRILNKNHITEIDLEFLDDVRPYDLLFTERNVFEKYCGIAKLHAGEYPINNALIKKLMQATGSNFVYLSELLKVIKPNEFESLKNINTNIVIQKIANQYIKNYNEDYKKLIDFAIINQYEISFNCKEYVYEPWFKRLVSENLVVANIREYHYDFYHTDFAHLLVKARFQSENRREEIKFTSQIFLDYLLENDFNSIRVDEIFQRLYSNSAKQILEDLFTNLKLKDKIIDYYKESACFEHTKPLCDLLTYINEFNPGDIKEYTKELIVKNKNIGALLSKDKTFVQSILKISFFLKEAEFPDYANFIKTLDLDFKIIPENISFVTMCNYLSEAGKYEEPLLELMNQIFTENNLLDKVNREELLTLTEGLGSLYKVYGITNNFIERIPLSVLVEAAEKAKIERLAKALLNLKNLGRQKIAESILEDLHNEYINVGFRGIDLKEALTAANILKGFAYTKIHRNFNLDNLEVNAELYTFEELINLLIEVYKFVDNSQIASTFINTIPISSWELLMQNEESHRIGMHLQLLSKCWGYRDKADDIFQLIPNGNIIANSKGLGFFKLAQLLHWFNKVQFEDNLKTKNLYEEFPSDEFQNNIEDLTFDNIVLSLRNLNQIDSIKTHTIFKENEELILGKLIFENIDLSLAQLADVNFEIGYAVLCSLLGNDDFKNWLLAQPLNKITRVLIKFSAIEKMKIESTHNNLISGFINSIVDSDFINSSKELRFDLLCSSLNEIASINKSVKAKFRDVVEKIGLLHFAGKMNETGDKKFDFSLIAQGFNNLYLVAPLFFEKLYKQEYNNIIKSASVTSLDNFTNGLKAIAKISEDKAREIFTDDKLNIEIIATDSKNYDLKNINRIIYFLKAYSLTKTEAVIGYFSLEDFAFKFERELNFDKATEYLSQLYPFNEKRIWEVVNAIGVESFYKRCKEKEIKLIIQGLSKISKIHKEVAQEVFEKIIEHRDIKDEMKSIIQFEDLSQKIREVKKVSDDDTLVDTILNSIGVNGFVQRANKSGKNQILMGFGSLSEINFSFTKRVATQLCKGNVKYANIFYGNSFLRNLIN